MKRTGLIQAGLVVAALAATAPAAWAQGSVCKYIDADGNIVFSNMPPEKGQRKISCIGGEEPLAHEPDNLPVTRGQPHDSVLASDRLGDLLVPLLGIGEETLGVDVDAPVGDHRHGHLVLLL